MMQLKTTRDRKPKLYMLQTDKRVKRREESKGSFLIRMDVKRNMTSKIQYNIHKFCIHNVEPKCIFPHEI